MCVCVCVAPVGKALYKVLVIQTFRADRLIAMASVFVSTVMGETYLHAAESELNLADVVMTEVRDATTLFVGIISSC